MRVKFVDIDWFFVCNSLRAFHMWLTRNHMFILKIWGKFTYFIFWNFQISLVSLRRFQSFKKVNSVNLAQISLLNMWSLVLIRIICAHIWPRHSKKLCWILKLWDFKWFLKRLRLTTFFGLIAFPYRHKPQEFKIKFLSLVMPQ